MSTATHILFERFPDNVRLSYIADNPDWDLISDSLVETGKLLEHGSLNLLQYFTIMRVIIECVYVLGYVRGESKKKINFVVQE